MLQVEQPDHGCHRDAREADPDEVDVKGYVEAPGGASHRARVPQPGDDQSKIDLDQPGNETKQGHGGGDHHEDDPTPAELPDAVR